jgi:hypothetical protein
LHLICCPLIKDKYTPARLFAAAARALLRRAQLVPALCTCRRGVKPNSSLLPNACRLLHPLPYRRNTPCRSISYTALASRCPIYRLPAPTSLGASLVAPQEQAPPRAVRNTQRGKQIRGKMERKTKLRETVAELPKNDTKYRLGTPFV